MNLPKLKVIQEEMREAKSCKEHDYCKTCQLHVKNGGRCDGCSPAKQESLADEFKWCYQECHSCTGYKANITAVCCRSPLKDMYLTAVAKGPEWNQPKYEFKQRPLLEFKRKAIFYYNFGSAKSIMGDSKDYLVDHEVVAVNLSYVKGFSGFYSNDLHDYLRIPKTTKIILTTMSIDDNLERCWEKEDYGGPEYREVGISYWMPLAFSSFAYDARMHQYYQALRTMYAMEKSKAHFYPGYYMFTGLNLDDLHRQGMEAAPQVMFNTQFFSGNERLPVLLQSLRDWHRLAPPGVAFWFVGAATPTIIHNTSKVCGDRDLYFVSSKPLHLGYNGKLFRKDGGESKVNRGYAPTKRDLILENYSNFEEMVNTYGR